MMELDALPAALHLLVAGHLTLADVGGLLAVCRTTASLATHPVLWRAKCEQLGLPPTTHRTPTESGGGGSGGGSQAASWWRHRLWRWRTLQGTWHEIGPAEPAPAPPATATTVAAAAAADGWQDWTAALNTRPAMFLHRATPATVESVATDGGADATVYVFGGGDLLSFSNDLWALRPAPDQSTPGGLRLQFKPVCAHKPFPWPQHRSACSWCALGDGFIYLFGGSQVNLFFDDAWRFHVAEQRFEQLRQSGPSSRWGHTAVHCRGVMYLFGGTCPGAAFDELWRYDPRAEEAGEPAWHQVHLQGSPTPPGRGGHSAAVVNGFMYVFGGNTLDESFNDHWRIDLDALERSLVATKGSDGDRAWPAFEDTMEEAEDERDHGGAPVVTIHQTQVTAEHEEPVVAVAPGQPSRSVLVVRHGAQWELVPPKGTVPPPRIGHTAVVFGSRVVLYGGRNLLQRRFTGGVFVFDPSTLAWRRLQEGAHKPANRTGHAALPLADGVVFVGGLKHGPPTFVTGETTLLSLLAP